MAFLLPDDLSSARNKKEEKKVAADPSPRIPIGSFGVSAFFSYQPR
jgi:hypothetical protein